jgi:acetyltransferase-like isoleucine patch superfamily enzyme
MSGRAASIVATARDAAGRERLRRQLEAKAPGVCLHHGMDDRDTDIRDQPLRCGALKIERDVWIGANAAVLPGVRIGHGAVIGANAAVLPGVRIGHGAVIGAGAVVATDVPAMAVALGAPARVARER